MIIIENTTKIARSPAEVFTFVSDVRNDSLWHTDVLEARLLEGESVGKGSVFAIKMKPFMGVSEGTEEVSEYEPPHRVVIKGRMGKMAPTTTLTVEPEGQGSRFTRRVEMKPPGLLRVMAPFMKGMAQKQAAGFLENLKRTLEAQPA